MALKKTYSKDKKTCNVTFTVTAEAAQGAKTVTIAGDFNSWSSTDTPLKRSAKDGSFSERFRLRLAKSTSSAICLMAAAGKMTGLLTNIFRLLSATLIIQSLSAKSLNKDKPHFTVRFF